ncbi:hypothetical protein JKP88DRAFT_241024 [Tribonema minus]|uniref:Uncharacterized protein n=1 Tax=Tribonema minus TaxID=303371 RepID=A0A836CH66_9STRA|nr:hypothetical protein JKP88DRAFT_241024 [Tribonema minus]
MLSQQNLQDHRKLRHELHHPRLHRELRKHQRELRGHHRGRQRCRLTLRHHLRDVLQKLHYQKHQAVKEVTQAKGTGIAPRFISYDGNLTLDMAFVQAQTLREYVAKMQDKIASDAMQTSFINVFETLRGMQVDPNDNNLGNFLVDTHAQKVYRIDFSDFKRRAAPYPFVLLSKVYKVFPRVAIAWRQHLQAEITPEWRHRLGYT